MDNKAEVEKLMIEEDEWSLESLISSMNERPLIDASEWSPEAVIRSLNEQVDKMHEEINARIKIHNRKMDIEFFIQVRRQVRADVESVLDGKNGLSRKEILYYRAQLDAGDIQTEAILKVLESTDDYLLKILLLTGFHLEEAKGLFRGAVDILERIDSEYDSLQKSLESLAQQVSDSTWVQVIEPLVMEVLKNQFPPEFKPLRIVFERDPRNNLFSSHYIF